MTRLNPMPSAFTASLFTAMALSAVVSNLAAQPSPQKSELWEGTITVHAHQGKACPQTAAGQSLPYRRRMVLQLNTNPQGRMSGFAWGEMLPTKLSSLVIVAAETSGGPATIEIQGPANVLQLTWLPITGPSSPGRLALSSALVLSLDPSLGVGKDSTAALDKATPVAASILKGRWSESLFGGKPNDQQCLWTEASVELAPVQDAQREQLLQDTRALQASLVLIDTRQQARGASTSQDRWSPQDIEELLITQSQIKAGSPTIPTLLPLLVKLADQVQIEQGAKAATPLLEQSVNFLEPLLAQAAQEHAGFVTQLTPMLRAANMHALAERLNRQAIDALRLQGFEKSAEMAQVMSGYGVLLLRLKNYQQAYLILERALQIERGLVQGKHIGVVIALVNLSRACELLGQNEQAKQLAAQASELHEALGLGPLSAPRQRGSQSA